MKSIEQIRKEKPDNRKLYKAENNLELHNNFRGQQSQPNMRVSKDSDIMTRSKADHVRKMREGNLKRNQANMSSNSFQLEPSTSHREIPTNEQIKGLESDFKKKFLDSLTKQLDRKIEYFKV